MLQALQKSKQLSVMALDRLGDYFALMRIEMQLQGKEIGVQLISYLAAALFALFALLFTGIAIIVSFWDSEFRGVAACVARARCIAGAGVAVAVAQRHVNKTEALASLREEFRRDVALVRENL